MLVKVNYYSLEPRILIAGTRNSYGFEALEFEFGDEWDGLDKTVTFYPVDGDPVALLITGEPVKIPIEVMRSAGRAGFTVSGYAGEKTLVSLTGYLDVLDANDPSGDLPETPTENHVAQLISVANEALSVAQSVRDDADNGVFKGETGSAGVGVCAGGSKGQFLVKKSATNYDTAWASPVKFFHGQIADIWEDNDGDISEYAYYCDLYLSGVTASSCVDVYFDSYDAVSGKLAPFCEVRNGYITLYSNDATYVEIPLIKVVTL